MLSFNAPNWLKAKQSEAMTLSKEMGWPSRKEESWRYTSLKELEKLEFSPVTMGADQFTVPQNISELLTGADHILYFYNGEYLKGLSSTLMHEDCVVMPLSRILMSAGRLQERAKTYLERGPNKNLKNIGLNNLANFNQGAFIELESKNNSKIKLAVVHLYGNLINSPEQKRFITYPRNTYSFGQNIEADIIELHIAVNDVQFQTVNSSDYYLAEGAKINAAKVVWCGQNSYSFNDINAQVGRNASLQFFDLVIGGKLVRNELALHLAHEGAELSVLNLNLGQNGGQIDNSTYIAHEKGHSKSEHFVKNILNADARAVFSGRLRIEQDAQKSDAGQYCHNLLLSDSAEVNAKPQLEVFADDVKAAHATTIGQLSAEQLFYLQSRAISKEVSKQMLVRGFQQDIIGKIRSKFTRDIIEKCLKED